MHLTTPKAHIISACKFLTEKGSILLIITIWRHRLAYLDCASVSPSHGSCENRTHSETIAWNIVPSRCRLEGVAILSRNSRTCSIGIQGWIRAKYISTRASMRSSGGSSTSWPNSPDSPRCTFGRSSWIRLRLGEGSSHPGESPVPWFASEESASFGLILCSLTLLSSLSSPWPRVEWQRLYSGGV